METATHTLNAALKAVTGPRNADYGPPTEDFQTQAELFSSYLSRTNGRPVYVTASDIAALMILVKIARQAHCPKPDNWIDAAGYAACGAECDAMQGTEEASKMPPQKLPGWPPAEPPEHGWPPSSQRHVPADFARKLEHERESLRRERDWAMARLAKLQMQLDGVKPNGAEEGK